MVDFVILDILRVAAYSWGGFAFAYLCIDDFVRQRLRAWVWALLLLNNLMVLTLLSLDVLEPGFWVRTRWLFTPVAILLASVATLYAVERYRITHRPPGNPNYIIVEEP